MGPGEGSALTDAERENCRVDMMRRFPRLAATHMLVTSDRSHRYNCFAFAVHDESQWISPVLWDPEQQLYPWPAGAPRGDTVAAWAAALGTFGFASCFSSTHETGFEKVAIFAEDDVARHVARQLPSGRWTSKIGKWEDIEHDLVALEGERYGRVVQVLKRPTAS